MTIRIAAIGVTHWHSVFDAAYLPLLLKMPDVSIVGLQDADPRIAASRAAMLGDPPTFTDYRQMLRETKPDFVLALGRHSEMAETAHYLLDNGLPFLMEKPMGIRAEEVLGIAEKAEAKGAFAAVPLPHRYVPHTDLARQMIADGRFGPLSHFYFRIIRPSSARYVGWDSPWMLDPAISAGGCLRNLGSHGLDLFLTLVGEPAEIMGATISAKALGQPVEDYAAVTVRSGSGVVGCIEVGNVYPRDGTDGEFKVSGRDALLLARDDTMQVTTAGGVETLPDVTEKSRSYLVLRDALDHWVRGDPPPTSARDLYPVVELIDRAYEMARA